MNNSADNHSHNEANEPATGAADNGLDSAHLDKPEPVGQAPAGLEASVEPAKRSASSKWLIGIVVVAGLVLLGALWNKKIASSPQETVSAASDTAASASSAALKQGPARFTEERPGVGGKEAFSLPQLRYCMAENIRLDAAKDIVNSHNRADVDQFNLLTADYNERCTNLRYKRGTLERAKAEVEQHRASIEAEGTARFSKKAAPTVAPMARAVPAIPAIPTIPAVPAVAKPAPKPAPKAALAEASPAKEKKTTKPELPLPKQIAAAAKAPAACSSSTECTGAALCLDGQCRSLRRSGEQCVYSHECAGSGKCLGGRCRSGGNTGDRCMRTQECSGANQCLDGQCRPLRVIGERCEASFECAGMGECLQGRCQVPQ